MATMPHAPYQHRQPAWVLFALAVPVTLLAIWLALTDGLWVAAAGLLVLTSFLLLLLGWLTVRVADGEIQARFGVGLIRRTVRLADVDGYRAVTNPWYYGWGIRLIPGGWLYNVSGRSAVEMDLGGGGRVRFGTDDPTGLIDALSRATGRLPSASSEEARAYRAGAARLIAIGVAAVVLVVVAVVLVVGRRPVRVEVTSEHVSVSGAGYTATVPMADMTRTTLEEQMPRVLRRTNGFAFQGRLRGHFDVESLGNGDVFVNRATPPFIVLQSAGGFLIFNRDDPAETRALFEQIRTLRGGR